MAPPQHGGLPELASSAAESHAQPSSPLEASPYPIAVLPQFIATKEETLVMINPDIRITTGRSTWRAKTTAGTDVFRIERGRSTKILTPRRRRTFFDFNGNELFVLEKVLSRQPTSFRAVRDKCISFEVHGKPSVAGSQSIVKFENEAASVKGQKESLLVTSTWRNKYIVVKNEIDGRILARIEKHRIGWHRKLKSDGVFVMKIAPGVDMSLIAALLVCVTMRRNSYRVPRVNWNQGRAAGGGP